MARKYVNYTNKVVNNLWVKRPATMLELQRFVPQVVKWVDLGDYKTVVRATKYSQHKYWYCMCIDCGMYHILRSDKLVKKKCQCSKKRLDLRYRV